MPEPLSVIARPSLNSHPRRLSSSSPLDDAGHDGEDMIWGGFQGIGDTLDGIRRDDHVVVEQEQQPVISDGGPGVDGVAEAARACVRDEPDPREEAGARVDSPVGGSVVDHDHPQIESPPVVEERRDAVGEQMEPVPRRDDRGDPRHVPVILALSRKIPSPGG